MYASWREMLFPQANPGQFDDWRKTISGQGQPAPSPQRPTTSRLAVKAFHVKKTVVK
jgi:hypothetical protein